MDEFSSRNSFFFFWNYREILGHFWADFLVMTNFPDKNKNFGMDLNFWHQIYGLVFMALFHDKI